MNKKPDQFQDTASQKLKIYLEATKEEDIAFEKVYYSYVSESAYLTNLDMLKSQNSAYKTYRTSSSIEDDD